ncbi:hypothetical protein V495_01461 [Pseudogymnoascus sp. VKM F-4514 (FW-929)]|nr:hypothetical protein V495_01461 [Pseudogymnoascus sp. VKM F-4514 (FW-929)]
MKFTLMLVGLGAMTVMAGTIQQRQNDLPPCIDGEGTVEGLWQDPNCGGKCFFRENAEGDNHLGVCAGACESYVSPPNGGVPLTGYICDIELTSWFRFTEMAVNKTNGGDAVVSPQHENLNLREQSNEDLWFRWLGENPP